MSKAGGRNPQTTERAAIEGWGCLSFALLVAESTCGLAPEQGREAVGKCLLRGRLERSRFLVTPEVIKIKKEIVYRAFMRDERVIF